MSALHRLIVSVIALVVVGSLSCSGRDASAPLRKPTALTQGAAQAESASNSSELAGNAERGRSLIHQHQCNRCHEGTGEAPAERNQHCVNCHQEILAGTFPAARDKLERWKPHVGYVRRVPSLIGIENRLDRAWIGDFLLNPSDVRPLLAPSMPRLALSPEDARDIATALTTPRHARRETAPPHPPSQADPTRGRQLLETRGCGSCHTFTRVPPLPQTPSAERAQHDDALLLAPDLAHVRQRWAREPLVRWLRDPPSIKSDTLMPVTGFDESQARDVASYLLETPLAPVPATPAFERLPPLQRRVTYLEVDEKILRVTCRHCHSNPDASLGDGGPGNTGGLGFRGRAIDLSSYRGLQSGYRDDRGERRSLFEPLPDGTPRLIAVLIARHDEERANPRSEIRGMPLGLPSLSREQIQLVDTWIAQGRPE
ncbi:MAG TPA: cytochrome C oxidase Cbb3 [Polyangiaceae bacterium]|nr:cytochrome C oxidase Cbb3 [Polyangiaceae bacterium]